MKYYGQFEPPVDKFIFERYFPNTNIEGVFVECGAFDGLTECSCRFFEETMRWKGYNFEPVPWIFETLQQNRPNSTNLNFGLSNEVRKATFHAVNHPSFGLECTNGSLKHTQSHKKILDEIGCTLKDVEVKLMTWKYFIEQYNITHVDLFVLDVEGHELSVLKGMENASVMPDIICIEYGHLGLSKVRQAMESLGYVYDITSHANAYFIKNEKIPLFIMRRDKNLLSTNLDLEKENTLYKQKVSELNDLRILEANSLKRRISELETLYNDIISSKSWIILEKIKKVLGRN